MNNHYHTHFKKISPLAKAAVKNLRAGWNSLTDEQKYNRMEACLEELASIYRIAAPTMSVEPGHHSDAGCYSPALQHITLVKYSIMTLLHEFRHHMQHTMLMVNVTGEMVEHDARGWSQSLYFQVAPWTYRRLVREGQLFFGTIPTRARCRETWTGRRLAVIPKEAE